MAYILYGISAVCLGISIFFYVKGKAGKKEAMLLALTIAEEAAKFTPPKWDDNLFASARKAIEESDKLTEEKITTASGTSDVQPED